MLNLKNTFTKAIFVFVAISNFSYASDAKFYLGLDASRQDLDLNTNNDEFTDSNAMDVANYHKNNSINPSVFAGVDMLDFLKIETSYTQSSARKKKNPHVLSDDASITLDKTNFQIKTKNISLDFKPYIKINDNFLVFAIVGASYNKININEKIEIINMANMDNIEVSNKRSINKLAPSVGFGLEYFILTNLSLRTQAKYIHLNIKKDSNLLLAKIPSMTQVNIGAAYYF